MLTRNFLIAVVLSLFIPIHSVTANSRPDFSAFTDVKEKKSQFFDYLHPIISKENKKILAERKTLMQAKKITPDVIEICRKYSKDCDDLTLSDIQRLLHRVDVIPPSLALAQAANESGWGTSRFAVDGNNYFGQWCFSEGCGIVPSRRAAGGKQEVKRFTSVHESVSAYMYNLNTGKAYAELRVQRADLRKQGEKISAEKLADCLLSYSERGKHYVDEIQNMIRHNSLVEKYDVHLHKMLDQQVN